MFLGCHLSVSGGYSAMGKTALSIGANTFQFFTRNPRGRGFKRPSEDDVAGLLQIIKENNFGPLVAHAPYTFNPASSDERIKEYTAEAMAEDVEFLEAIPGCLYNFHPGCHTGAGSDVGIANVSSLLNRIISPTQSTLMLIETMAGKGTEIGKTFEEIRAIIDGVDEDKRHLVGVCLDTCHVWDGGYDIAGETERVLERFDAIIGMSRLKAVHLNESKNPLGARKDRHEILGAGSLTMAGIENIVTNPMLEDLPVCLETPNELDGYKREIELVRRIRGEI